MRSLAMVLIVCVKECRRKAVDTAVFLLSTADPIGICTAIRAEACTTLTLTVSQNRPTVSMSFAIIHHDDPRIFLSMPISNLRLINLPKPGSDIHFHLILISV